MFSVKKRGKRKPSQKEIIFSAAIFFLAALLTLFGGADETADTKADLSGSPSNNGNLYVHYLDVGQGSGALVESDGHYMLIDGGDRAHSSFVVSYLQKAGVEALDYVLATHYHADHLSGVIGAMNAFSCRTVLCPDYMSDTSLYQSFLRTAQEKGIPLIHPALNDTFSIGSAAFTVIAPADYTYENDNDNSIGIRLVNGGDVFLFTGDAEAESEEDFCRLVDDLSCDVYAAGHHGSATSTTWTLLEKALPEYVVISCGADNPYGHPHEETMEKMEAIGAGVFRTDLQGTVIASSSGDGITFKVKLAADFSHD